MQPTNQPDPKFLQQRLDAISAGFKKAIRREVQRLRTQGLPVYVAKNGTVILLPPENPNQAASVR